MIDVDHFVVRDGNAVQISIDWFDMTGDSAATPASVRYQTFDFGNPNPISEIVPVADPASSMTFIVPASDIPGLPNLKERHIILQVEGQFATDVHTEQVHLIVQRRLTFIS